MERVAISVVNFEEGAELLVGDGDPASELVGEVTCGAKARDLGQEQILAYGTRVWSVAFSTHKNTDTAATLHVWTTVERSPQLARAVSDAGHETASRRAMAPERRLHRYR